MLQVLAVTRKAPGNKFSASMLTVLGSLKPCICLYSTTLLSPRAELLMALCAGSAAWAAAGL